MKQVLFLCSGNYYRSRFAEYLFNSLAERKGLPWRADSRGLALGSICNIGPISRYAIDRLHALGISLHQNPRLPRQLAESDLAESDLIIALKEVEHRPLLANLFPSWVERIHYWHIDDLDCAEPEEALSMLENNIRAFMGQLDTGFDAATVGAGSAFEISGAPCFCHSSH